MSTTPQIPDRTLRRRGDPVPVRDGLRLAGGQLPLGCAAQAHALLREPASW